MKWVCHSVTVSSSYSRPTSHKLEFAGEGGKKFLVDVDRGPCHSISEALLAKTTEALLANYRMRFKSQSATALEQ